jgi:hypothetical protein
MPGTKNPSISSQRKKAIDAWDEDEFGNLVRKGKAKATKLPEGSKTEQAGTKGRAKASKSPIVKQATKGKGVIATDQPKDITKKKAE